MFLKLNDKSEVIAYSHTGLEGEIIVEVDSGTFEQFIIKDPLRYIVRKNEGILEITPQKNLLTIYE